MANRPRPTVDYAANSTRPVTQPTRTNPPTVRPRPTPTPTPTTVAAVTKPPVARPPVTAPVRDGGWRVQLGAFGDPNNARKLWAQLGGRFPGRQVYYVKQGSLTKVLVGPYASRGEAAGACGSIKPCVPVGP
jgi:cell division septation protein DedD